ncbi:MAG: phasin family protein [Rhodospirillaceae bacterium]|nr:phasin family protein [Rhodospirillales bacterium]
MSERRSELKAVASAEDLAAKLTGRDVANLTAQWVDGWSQINSRLIALAQLPLRNSVTAADQLRQCQSPTDIMDIQLKLARQAYDEYVDETRQLSELVVKLSSSALPPMENKGG